MSFKEYLQEKDKMMECPKCGHKQKMVSEAEYKCEKCDADMNEASRTNTEAEMSINTDINEVAIWINAGTAWRFTMKPKAIEALANLSFKETRAISHNIANKVEKLIEKEMSKLEK